MGLFLDCESRTPFKPATLQNLFPRLIRISFHKSVLGFAMPFVWLICSLWHIIP